MEELPAHTKIDALIIHFSEEICRLPVLQTMTHILNVCKGFSFSFEF